MDKITKHRYQLITIQYKFFFLINGHPLKANYLRQLTNPLFTFIAVPLKGRLNDLFFSFYGRKKKGHLMKDMVGWTRELGRARVQAGIPRYKLIDIRFVFIAQLRPFSLNNFYNVY